MSRHVPAAALAAALALPLAAGPATAQSSDLERFEAAAEAMSDQMFSLMAREQPAVAGALPDTEWDAAYREAGACVLDRIRAATSAENVDRMLAELETLGSAEFDTLAEMRAANEGTGPGLPQEQMVTINRECGMERLMRERMIESGFIDAMQQAAQGG